MTKKFLVRVYEERGKSKNFTVSSKMCLEDIAERLQYTLQRVLASENGQYASKSMQLCHTVQGEVIDG